VSAKFKILKGVPTKNEGDPTAWMLPYSTLMIILLIFFAALYALGQQNSVEYEAAIAEMAGDQYKDQARKETVLAKNMIELLDREGLADMAKVQITVDRIHVSLTSSVMFELGRADLQPVAILFLDLLVDSLKGMNNNVIVEGHTDNLPIRGPRYFSNWELSAARAFSVIRYLQDHDIPPERLVAYGYGENRPVASNETEEGRGRNRRIELSILRGGRT